MDVNSKAANGEGKRAETSLTITTNDIVFFLIDIPSHLN